MEMSTGGSFAGVGNWEECSEAKEVSETGTYSLWTTPLLSRKGGNQVKGRIR